MIYIHICIYIVYVTTNFDRSRRRVKINASRKGHAGIANVVIHTSIYFILLIIILCDMGSYAHFSTHTLRITLLTNREGRNVYSGTTELKTNRDVCLRNAMTRQRRTLRVVQPLCINRLRGHHCQVTRVNSNWSGKR